MSLRRLFPHPVLMPEGDDYGDAKFGFELVDKQIQDEYVTVSGNRVLDSDFLKHLIAEKRAVFLTMTSCSRTYKRKIDQHETDKVTLNLPLSDYADDIIIEPYIVSSEKIYGFSSDEHNTDYSNIDIDVPKGAILAIGNSHKLTVDMLSTLTSAISLLARDSMDEDRYGIDLGDQRIKILLNPVTKKKVDILRSRNQEILFPALYMPVLTYAISKMGEHEGEKWSKSLLFTLKKHKIDENEIKEEPHICAQKLLENPLKHVIRSPEQFD